MQVLGIRTKAVFHDCTSLIYIHIFVAVDSRQGCCHNRTVLEKILAFGRDLQNMSVQLRREHGKNETNKKALRVCTKVIVFLGKYHEK